MSTRTWPLLLLLLAALNTAAALAGQSTAERLQACLDQEDAAPAQAIALAEAVLAERGIPSAQRADALGCRGWARLGLGQLDEARRDARELRSLLPQLSETPERVRLTRRAGSILHRGDDRIAAVDLYAQAIADAEAQNLEVERIPLLINLGVLHSEFEEHERAEINYTQALHLIEQYDQQRYEAPVRYNLALNLSGQERYAEAVPLLERVADLLEGSDTVPPVQRLGVQVALATALQNSGDGERAQQILERIRDLELSSDDPEIRAQLVQVEAARLTAAGEPQAALAVLTEVDLSVLTHIRQWRILRQRAQTLEQLGEFEPAAQIWREIAEMREAYLRNQNLERLASLESHLRDREQQLELDRLRLAGEEQALRLASGARWQRGLMVSALIVLVLGAALVLWQRRMNRRLDMVSRIDPLSGLGNRRDMTERLRERCRRNGGGAAVLLIDVDLFKQINDRHGHAAGDQVLVAFSQRLRTSLGDGAVAARWGGEEFLVLVDGCGHDAVRTLAEHLRQQLAGPIDLDTGSTTITASIGYANLPLPGDCGVESWQYSLQLADDALYQAKAAGRNAVAGYWVETTIDEWPAARMGREAGRARAMGVIRLATAQSQ